MKIPEKLGLKKPSRSELELISIHIPKSGGTSFRNTLGTAYGRFKICRLDIAVGKEIVEVKVNRKLWQKRELPRGKKVIHGHFSYKKLTEGLDIDPNVPVIIWVRDPVERVVSNYYYNIQQFKKYVKISSKGANIVPKLQRDLLEFASNAQNQNKMIRYFEGLELEQFLFIGVVEHYEEDLEELSALLGWEQKPQALYHNKTEHKSKISNEDRKRLKELNREDVLLYERILELRNKRISDHSGSPSA